MEEEFKLPMEWYIAVSNEEDCELYWNYFNVGPGRSVTGTWYYTFDKHVYCEESEAIDNYYTKITTEQFKRYVLKQGNIEEKEIIGYKVPFELFNGEIKEGFIYKPLASKDNKYYAPVNLENKVGLPCFNLPKEIVEQWESVYKEIEFKVGDWVTVTEKPTEWSSKCNRSCPFEDIYPLTGRISKMEKDSYYTAIELCDYGFDISGLIEKDIIRLATKEEIESYLKKEAIRRGFKAGVTIKKSGINSRFTSFTFKPINDSFAYDFKNDILDSNGNGYIYEKGQWSEILSSFPQIEINGYKGEFLEDYVKFGCAEIASRLFIDLYETCAVGNKNMGYYAGNKQIECITIGKGTFTKKQIKEIAEYYLNK